MKTKKLSKKLGLNKKTIANLNKSEMEMANGGACSLFVSCTSEYPCNTSWDVCDPTNCSTICDWTERPTCIPTE